MEENKSNKFPILTLISGLLTILNIGTFVYFLFAAFGGVGNFKVALIIAIIVVVVSLVFAIIAKKENKISVLIPILTFNVLIALVSPITMIIGGIGNSITERRNERQQIVDEEATIDYCKSIIKDRRISLTSEKQAEEHFSYYDYDEKIVNKFISLEFQYSNPLDSDNYNIDFFTVNGYSARFTSDYRNLKIHAEEGFLLGSCEKDRYYSLSDTDANEFKQMIADEIDKQREACSLKEQEIKSELTIKNVINRLNSEENVVIRIHSSSDYHIKDVEDKNKIVFTFINQIDESTITFLEDENKYLTYGFEYEGKTIPCGFYFLPNGNYLILYERYKSPYEEDYIAYNCFKLLQEDGEQLMELATSLEE